MTELTTVTVRYGRHHNLDRTVELAAEPTACPHLVVTPGIASDEDGRVYFRGGVTLTHTGTGRALASDMHSYRLHQLAQKLTDELPEFDWNFTDTNHLYAHPDKRDAAGAVIREWQMADAYRGPVRLYGDDDAKAAARESDPAATLLGENLEWWIEHSKNYMEELDWDNPDHQRARVAEISVSVNGYAFIYLLAVLQRVDPTVADIAARDLVGQFDAGDSLGEWVWQWREEFAEGKPLSLRGIPDADPLAGFTA
ncbi:hypothetical protein [Mycolicibacterium conceptionense]|uniref:hypothetical protein n=1 Tax=Mycolicibacterium conceptionense TaxID=451644 RepID=UPI003204CEC5